MTQDLSHHQLYSIFIDKISELLDFKVKDYRDNEEYIPENKIVHCDHFVFKKKQLSLLKNKYKEQKDIKSTSTKFLIDKINEIKKELSEHDKEGKKVIQKAVLNPNFCSKSFDIHNFVASALNLLEDITFFNELKKNEHKIESIHVICSFYANHFYSHNIFYKLISVLEDCTEICNENYNFGVRLKSFSKYLSTFIKNQYKRIEKEEND